MPVLVMQVLLGTRRTQVARYFPIRIMHKTKSGRVSPATVSQNVARLLEGRSRASKEKVLNAILLGIINVCIELARAAEGPRGDHEKQSAFPKTPFSRSLPQIPMRVLRRAEPAGEDFSAQPSNTRRRKRKQLKEDLPLAHPSSSNRSR